MELEYRALDLTGVKVDKEKRTITGRAIPYNSMSNELRTSAGDAFREVIMPGAVKNSLAANDIMAYKEHDPAMLMGRTSAGTLVLEDMEDGLYATICVPDTSYGNDALVSAARGDLKGFSFGFNKPKTRNFTRSGTKIREIGEMNLREVSVVSAPAYSATTLALRAEDFVEETSKLEETRTEAVAAVVEEVKPDHSKEIAYWKTMVEFYEATQPRAK